MKLPMLTLLLLIIANISFKVSAQTPSTTATPTNTLETSITPSVSITTTPINVSQTPTVSVSPTQTQVVSTITPTPTSDLTQNDAIKSVISVKTQYPWNKLIPVTLLITPAVSGTRLEIKWQKSLGIYSTKPNYIINNPQAGVTYKVNFNLEPKAAGRQRAVSNIILTTPTSNYVTSQDVLLSLDRNLVITPSQQNYIYYVATMYVSLIMIFLILLPFAAYKYYLYFKKEIFPKWLESKIQQPI